jgi:NAD+ synthase
MDTTTARQEIITELGVVPTINPVEELQNRTSFLADYLATSGLKGYALGISGGQDSILAGWIAQRAVEQARMKGYNATFHALLLPYGQQADRNDALLACDFIQPDTIHDFDIQKATDAFTHTFKEAEGEPIKDFDKGNVKARMRMIAHYAIAGANQLLVVGTDHAAEAVTGFFTKYGDGGADILPLSGLTKRQGRQLLVEIGAPDIFITKPPTADLLDSRPGQADEYELGISYDQIDDYLEGNSIDEDMATTLENRYRNTVHKRTVPVAYEQPVSVVGKSPAKD